jgi:putative glutamine amidotransferase
MDCVRVAGGQARAILATTPRPVDKVLNGLDGLLLTGGVDVAPSVYQNGSSKKALSGSRDSFEFPLLQQALDMNMPVLGICRGMQVINVALGGSLIQDLHTHKASGKKGHGKSAFHRIWVSPGSKLARILGSGGTVKVNSRHDQGLREAQKAPSVLASAYSEDFLIEAIESLSHKWVIGVQWHPERREEVPPQFIRLFKGLVANAKMKRAL